METSCCDQLLKTEQAEGRSPVMQPTLRPRTVEDKTRCIFGLFTMSVHIRILSTGSININTLVS